MTTATLVRQARLVPVRTPPAGEGEPVDLRIVDGVVAEVAPALAPATGELVVEAAGRWAVPGLWDQHVHMAQAAHTRIQVDLTGSAGPEEVLDRVLRHVEGLPAASEAAVLGFGFRSAAWARPATVDMLDAVVADRPVVLISGDAHNGWLNTRALTLLDAPATAGPLQEREWFEVFARLGELPGDPALLERAYRTAAADAAAAGVVGIVDMDFGRPYADWPGRTDAGIDQLRVRTAVYPDRLDEVVGAGLRTGTPLDPSGLVTMGPLKIISDGSLNTRTAYCCQPYAPGERPHGQQNYGPEELGHLLRRAVEHGLRVAVHAIGDAATTTALDAFAQSGAAGTVEHAQLVRLEDLPRMAALGVGASVQPAHLLDDREITGQIWADRADRCFLLRSMHDAGVRLGFGSDAPVAPLDPWLAMDAAVHRARRGEDPWNAAEVVPPALALASSTDGQDTLAVGSRGDVVLLDDEPLAAVASRRAPYVAATLVGGRPTHLTL
ncbi:amidohydrolase [uncultured Nocardioides sp.]|uniref:Exoenzymes regulatory protein AepA in lipid-linked oligosaccharide synthesis cluster n=1 Tax=uncultured Nocardioides sp. TaxID=198441 RepID=A0A6J4PPX8_9ACTN|nr:amidohydrolase family protein [uncultured Nocardioides sp.]CAA9418643.1 MAG: Exoenzymes regulatory protein AepA in lipid-linked oligosaccharide synthesis cluster [uncultured Nocardioides sp.]